jgi:hypothetical protein
MYILKYTHLTIFNPPLLHKQWSHKPTINDVAQRGRQIREHIYPSRLIRRPGNLRAMKPTT